ncbi:MAG: aldehyde dehydrogenase family protein [Caldithrix sp.]|nr:aldehyde dehydrogenase family protein [Caldithrix sp.]
MKSVNPATNAFIKDYPEHSEQEVVEILKKVNNRYQSWKQQPFSNRSSLMHKTADLLRSKTEELARLMSVEMGKIIREARAEVEKCAWVCDYYADNAEHLLADEPIETDASNSFISFEPIGTILAVMPWNFPFWQVFRFAAPALMAGNTAVLKHASNVPGCALAIEQIFSEAGFPDDTFRTLMIRASAVPMVIKDDRIKAVTLTGSEPAGKTVASLASENIKKSVLELGGSDPFIVLDDADIPACIKTSATARMINTGQSCIAAKRFIVVQSQLATFEKQQTQIMAGMKVGDPLDEKSEAGPLARMDLVRELNDQVQKSIEQGARVLTGGKPIDGDGAFYQPTVLTDVRKGMPVYEQETFGPVSAIIPVKDAEEAVNVANDSRFGLGGSIWSRDIAQAIDVARRIETGGVFINGMTKSDPRLPFGGIKKSGYGRELSYFGIREFVNIKTIWVA